MAKKEPIKDTAKNKGGAPTKYKEEYALQVYKLCLLGAIDTEIANFFEVDADTIYEWKKVHIKFSEAIKKGKGMADATVANSLYKRANGFKAMDVDIKVIDGMIVETPLIKHYPPDTTAAIFWLKNRQKDKWRDAQHIDYTTKGESVHAKPDMSTLTDDEIRQMAAIQRKIKGDGAK